MKKILISIISATLLATTAFAEPDSGEFIPKDEPFDASHIYIEPSVSLVFPAYVFDASNAIHETPKFGFSAGIGYNWGGWLFGLEATRDWFGRTKKEYPAADNFISNSLEFRLRRVLSQATISKLPHWLEIVPGLAGGIDIFQMATVKRGDEVAPFWRASVELAIIPGTERAAPYLGFDYNFLYNDSKLKGTVAYPRLTLGMRMYLFGGSKKAPAAATVSTQVEPKTGFTPDGDGNNDVLVIKPTVKNLKSTPESWKVEVRDQQKEVVKSWEGTGKLPSKIDWDGTTISGERLFSSERYTVATTVVPSESDRIRLEQDVVTDETRVKTGVLMEEIIPQKQWKIVVNTIYFDPNAATFEQLSTEQQTANTETLDSIASQTLALSADIKIEVQGYANNVSNTAEENEKELIPLSRNRAEAIKEQLKVRGLKEKNLSALGLGGANPLAAWEDKAHWWKNRRVEFIVTK